MHSRSAEWQELQEWNLVRLAKAFFIIWSLLSNLSLREPAHVSLLIYVLSLISDVFKRLNYLWGFFYILRIDDRLISVCLAIFLGAKGVWWGLSSFEQTKSSIKSMFSFVEAVLGYADPCLLLLNQFLWIFWIGT